MANRIAFNPQDRFLVTMGNQLIVTTKSGDVFGHDFSGSDIGPAFKFTGARAAFNPQDRFVVTMGNKLIVTTENGDVFGHDVSGRDVGPAFKFTGSKAAFNRVDRFVVTMGNKLIVTTENGDVFGHEVSGRDVGPAFKFTGSKAAFNREADRFVVTMGNQLIVTTRNGDVFGHDVSGRDISPAFKFTGAKAAFNPQDRFVVTSGNKLIVTTQNGDAFAHEVSGRDIGPHFPLNMDTVTLDSGSITSGLTIGGNARLVMSRTGETTFSGHLHDSGALGINYVLSLIAMTPSGIAYTSQREGHVAGTFTPGGRDDDWTASATNDKIRDNWTEASQARLSWNLRASDTTTPIVVDALEQALKEAVKQARVAGVKAVIALF